MRELDSPYLWMMLRGNVGLAALLTGDTDAARRGVPRGARSSAASWSSSRRLEGLAAWPQSPRSRRPRPRRATLGAAAAHRYGGRGRRSTPGSHETFFEPARARCGDDGWDAAVREGAALSFDDAIAYALDE